jgi:hypothetical protein
MDLPEAGLVGSRPARASRWPMGFASWNEQPRFALEHEPRRPWLIALTVDWFSTLPKQQPPVPGGAVQYSPLTPCLPLPRDDHHVRYLCRAACVIGEFQRGRKGPGRSGDDQWRRKGKSRGHRRSSLRSMAGRGPCHRAFDHLQALPASFPASSFSFSPLSRTHASFRCPLCARSAAVHVCLNPDRSS